ncbi:MAG: hypothetical protein JOY54_20730 [Acidobacteriaceae bacterium]|nr:hypothetical protein [Acidobacteriaceae bacterium]
MAARLGFLFVSLLVLVKGQALLAPEEARELNHAIDAGLRGDRLGCNIQPEPVSLSFSFRFEAGYTVTCPVRVFDGKEGQVYSFVRVTPENGESVVLGERFGIPAIPPDPSGDFKKVRAEIEFSGAFAIGEGQYSVEVIVADHRKRLVRKQWRIHASRHRSEQSVQIAMEPASVAPLLTQPWDGGVERPGTGRRVTIIVDAAPINPRALKLHAWDRALLLDCVSSLLAHTDFRSVRLIAINLDQQREIFREDNLDRKGWSDLGHRLRDLELGTVSYKVVEDQQGWSNLLIRLLRQEAASREPSDAVIFVGPTSRITSRLPAELLPKEGKGEFFYIEYYPAWLNGGEFPDALAHITRALGGEVLKIHSPGELAQAIQKIQKRLAPQDTGPAPH